MMQKSRTHGCVRARQDHDRDIHWSATTLTECGGKSRSSLPAEEVADNWAG